MLEQTLQFTHSLWVRKKDVCPEYGVRKKKTIVNNRELGVQTNQLSTIMM